MVLVSTPEGEDKPLKYPTIFNTADIAVITKLDLADAAGVDLNALIKNVKSVRPGIELFEVSGRTNTGIDDLTLFLTSQPERQTVQAV